jgi:hypothetical protein
MEKKKKVEIACIMLVIMSVSALSRPGSNGELIVQEKIFFFFGFRQRGDLTKQRPNNDWCILHRGLFSAATVPQCYHTYRTIRPIMDTNLTLQPGTRFVQQRQ